VTIAKSGDATIEQMESTRNKSARRIPTISYTIGLIVVLGILFTLGNSNFILLYNLNTIVSFAAILLLVALGQMSAVLTGGIDLSVGGLISFVSVIFVLLIQAVGYWAYPACILVGMLFGYINGVILTRIRIPSFIVTLGTGGILTSLAMLISARPVNVPSSTYGLLEIVNGSTLGISNILYIGLAFFLLFLGFFRFTTTGRKIFYVGSNIKMSWMSGVNIVRTRNVAFMLSGLGAAVASLMISAIRYGGDPSVGNVYVLNSVAAVVVGGTALTGGTGGVVNTLLGALLMSMLDNGMNVVGIDQYFQQSILGLMIIISVTLTFDRTKTPVIK
jgi:ribose transport system permease protein